MDNQEKQAATKTISRLLNERLGDDHGCNVDIGAILRASGDTSIRFECHGAHWKLSYVGGEIYLAADE